jgi:hypothetical protein
VEALMEWFGVDVAFILSAEWQALPAEVRANWLSLHAYCSQHENGGRLEGAAKWRDREWRFAAGMTSKGAAAMMRFGLLRPASVGHALPTPGPRAGHAGPTLSPCEEDLILRAYDADGEQKAHVTSRIKRKAAEARWSKNARASEDANAQPLPPAMHETRRDETRRDEEESVPLLIPFEPRWKPDFEALYQGYPLKKGKDKGMAACKKQIRTPAEFEQLRVAIANYAAEVRGKDPQYTKHFSTFMGCWRDYLDASPSSAPAPTTPHRAPIAVAPVGDRHLAALERDARRLGLVDAEGNPT